MGKHITIIPDCPKCGTELKDCYKSLPPFTDEKPWGSSFEAWHFCPNCDFETEHAKADHKDEAKNAAFEIAKKYCAE